MFEYDQNYQVKYNFQRIPSCNLLQHKTRVVSQKNRMIMLALPKEYI